MAAQESTKLFNKSLGHNLIGHAFSRLTVVERASKGKSGARCWLCKCTCGGKTITTSSNLLHGNVKSCGCLPRTKTHGKYGTRVYRIWRKMIERCTRKKNSNYARYGGRGITVCERWINSFPNFFSDMGAPPTDKHSIDRIDNAKGYELGNCRWATPKEQARNKRGITC